MQTSGCHLLQKSRPNLMQKGSLSVFYAMIMTFILTLMFTMAECIRVFAMDDRCQVLTDEAVESLFSEYNPYLWEKYEVLALDMAYGTNQAGSQMVKKKLTDYALSNANTVTGGLYPNANFLQVQVRTGQVNEYTLITDSEGQVLIKQVAENMKILLAQELLEDALNGADPINETTTINVDEMINNAAHAIEEDKRAREEAKEPVEEPQPVEIDNPVNTYIKLKQAAAGGILGIVMTDAKAISEGSFEGQRLTQRKLNSGKGKQINASISDRLIFLYWLNQRCGYYGNEKEHDSLKYELEYVIGGEASDRENLAEFALKLMGVRMAADFSSILSDPAKVAQAREVAACLAGVTLNPAVVETLAYAIMGIWAYVEAVLDVRSLFAGGKVSAVKGPAEWTSSIFSLSAYIPVNVKAKNCPSGMDYDDYLKGFLMAQTNKNLAYRTMDLMEDGARKQEGFTNFQLDKCMVEGSFEITYSAESVFYSIFPLAGSFDGIAVSKSRQLDY